MQPPLDSAYWKRQLGHAAELRTGWTNGEHFGCSRTQIGCDFEGSQVEVKHSPLVDMLPYNHVDVKHACTM